jgi:hypothetical protein
MSKFRILLASARYIQHARYLNAGPTRYQSLELAHVVNGRITGKIESARGGVAESGVLRAVLRRAETGTFNPFPRA